MCTSSIGVVLSGLCAKTISTASSQRPPRLHMLVLTVVELETLERRQGPFDDVLPAQPAGVVLLATVGAEEDLGGDDDVSAVLDFP